ncbi:hypothetical protein [Chryseobacterium gambrini]|uniref:hypothetical protein n=1 Tax=Chryseobacterium gambrini TaxID=373672 RepID=UPI003D114F8A
MNAQQQDFEKLFRTELEAVKFEIPEDQAQSLYPLWLKLMRVNSMQDLDMDHETHSNVALSLINGKADFNLYNISFLLNALGRTSPMKLDIALETYIYFISQSKQLSDKWNEIVLPIRNKLVNKLQTQQALQMPKNGMNVIPGRR